MQTKQERQAMISAFIIMPILILLLIRMTLSRQNQGPNTNADCKLFFATAVHGRIAEIGVWNRNPYVEFEGERGTSRFIYTPLRQDQQRGRFERFVHVGDSISKPALADTMYIMRGNTYFTYPVSPCY